MWYEVTQVLYVVILGGMAVFTAMEIKDGVKLLVDEIREDKIKLEEEEEPNVTEIDITTEAKEHQ